MAISYALCAQHSYYSVQTRSCNSKKIEVPVTVDQIPILGEETHGNFYNCIKYCFPLHAVILFLGSEI